MPNRPYVTTIASIFIFVVTAFGQQPNTDALIKKYKHIKSDDSAANYVRELTGIAQKNHDQLFEARILYAQSFRLFSKGDEATALTLAYQANKLTSAKDSVTYTQSATMIAYMLSHRGKNVEALNVAFDILRKTDTYGWHKQSIGCLLCIGDLYRAMGDPEKSLPYGTQALKIAQSLKDTNWYMSSAGLLSGMYSATKIATPTNLNIAAGYLETLLAPPYAAKLSRYNQAMYWGNLGRIYEKQNKFDKAKQTLLKSLTIATEGKFVSIQKHSLNELMTNEIDQGHYSDAIAYAKQIFAVQANEKTDRVQVRNIYHQLGRAYEGLHDYKTALDYHKKSQDITDSLNDADKDKVATELAEKYKADKRLIIADDQQKEATLQRNFIIVIAIFLLLTGIGIYRWFANKTKRENMLLSERHAQLARLDAMKTRFFANISHELRTPLTLIMGPTEQLLKKPEIDEQQQQTYLKAVFRNSKKLLNLVNELLDLGKIEAGTLSVKLKPVGLAWFVNVIYQSFSSAAAYKNITYTLSNNIPEDVFVDLDADKFEKIANNLLSNAIKFTQSYGSVNVVAAVKDGRIEFTVTDTGKGIHPNDLPLIFDRYYQANRDTEAAEGGTGIGLAIAMEFSELLGGGIRVKSSIGSGSTFTAFIPAIPASSNVAHVQKQEEIYLPDKIINAEGDKLVLLVEDHHEMAEYISSIIEPSHRVVTTGNGKEALEVLRKLDKLPELIISDVMMPEMDGFTLLEHLKQDASFCRIPVIMLTALGESQNKLKALNIGVDDYLTKPFVSSELLARANNLINNAADRRNYSKHDEQEFAILENSEDNLPGIASERTDEISPSDLRWLTGLEAAVRKHIGKTDLNMSVLSDELALSERQLFRRIKNITGLAPNKYIRDIRLQIAREAIESGRYRTIAEISYLAGFDTPAYFSKLFKEHYGRDVNELL